MSTSTASKTKNYQYDEARNFDSGADISATGPFPSFDRWSDVSKAHAARIAGRLNAASISDLEHRDLLRERQQLLDKHFAGSITQKEKNRLEYVRWSLDRIEDAKHGATLDRIEHAVSLYENFVSDLKDLSDKLQSIQPSERPGR